jgi:uncharacterized protein (TIGR00730 family)
MPDLAQIAVFCGSSTGNDPRHVDAAEALGAELAARGLGLVYGGASVGLMGRLADACLEAGGRVVGVIPVGLFRREVPHTGLDELVEVTSMHDRKRIMYELADAFVALPGGLGTLEELAEVLTWVQLGLLAKPVGILDVNGHFGGLLEWLDRTVRDGYLRPEQRSALLVDEDPRVLLDALSRAGVEVNEKWLDLDQA